MMVETARPLRRRRRRRVALRQVGVRARSTGSGPSGAKRAAAVNAAAPALTGFAHTYGDSHVRAGMGPMPGPFYLDHYPPG